MPATATRAILWSVLGESLLACWNVSTQGGCVILAHIQPYVSDHFKELSVYTAQGVKYSIRIFHGGHGQERRR